MMPILDTLQYTSTNMTGVVVMITRWINFYLNGGGRDSITWNGSNIVYGNS